MNIKQVTINGKTVITVDGKRYEIEGSSSSVVVKNNKVFVNGKLLDDFTGSKSKVVEVKIEGNIGNLEVYEGNATISGNVEGNVKADGSVECKDVGGSVDAGGSARCGNVQGNLDSVGSAECKDVGGSVDAGGSVRCGDVKGDIDAGGSVRHG